MLPSCAPSTRSCVKIVKCWPVPGAAEVATTWTSHRRDWAPHRHVATCTDRTREEPVRPGAATEWAKRSEAWNAWPLLSVRMTTRAACTSGCMTFHRWPAILNWDPITRPQRPCLYCRTCPVARASCWRIWPVILIYPEASTELLHRGISHHADGGGIADKQISKPKKKNNWIKLDNTRTFDTKQLETKKKNIGRPGPDTKIC